MKGIFQILLRFIIVCFYLQSCSSTKSLEKYIPENAIHFADSNLALVYHQYKFFSQQIPDSAFPRSLDNNGNLITSKSDWWCSGFYPGSLLYLQETIKDAQLKKETKEKLKLLEKEKYNTSTHDLGFMMYCSYGNLNRVAPDSTFKNILIQSAQSLATRYSDVTKSIRSWNSSNNKEFIVIIDNMMNLELLFYASKVTGDKKYYDIAVTHANTTLKNHFRRDNSSYHLVVYNTEDGNILSKKTAQGAADSSAWARGQAWGLYGYTVTYRETKDKKYLEQAKKIAGYMLDHENMPADKIPYWDYNAAGIPNALRDASAAAIMCSALLELSTYDGSNRKKYIEAASSVLHKLSSPEYLSAPGENKGFLLKHGVGHLPAKSEVDVPLTYADYYFIEALLRYKKLALGEKLH